MNQLLLNGFTAIMNEDINHHDGIEQEIRVTQIFTHRSDVDTVIFSAPSLSLQQYKQNCGYNNVPGCHGFEDLQEKSSQIKTRLIPRDGPPCRH